jgi:ribosomal protein S12 methylthiotransferase accessory factor
LHHGPVSLEVLFPGGKRVDVKLGDHVVNKDQSVKLGGEHSAPEPFNLLLTSMAACAGIYALNFCETLNLSIAGVHRGAGIQESPPGRKPGEKQSRAWPAGIAR